MDGSSLRDTAGLSLRVPKTGYWYWYQCDGEWRDINTPCTCLLALGTWGVVTDKSSCVQSTPVGSVRVYGRRVVYVCCLLHVSTNLPININSTSYVVVHVREKASECESCVLFSAPGGRLM